MSIAQQVPIAALAPLAAVLLALGLAASPPARSQESPDELAKAVAAAVAPRLDDSIRRRPNYVEVRSGWLVKTTLLVFRFLNPELFEATDADDEDSEQTLARVVATVADAHRQLAARGVELLVVPLPTRLNVYPEALIDVELGDEFRGCAPGLERLCERLRAEGVEVLELLPHLAAARGQLDASEDQLVFLNANAHWTPKGMALCAEVLAEHVRARPWYTAPAEPTTRLERFAARWEPDGEQLPDGVQPPVLEFERVLTLDGERVPRADSESAIVLWGDSFTTIYKAEGADLPRRLAHLLGTPIDVIASLGGGVDSTRLNFARRRDPTAGKRIVIWAFSTRSLMSGQWKPKRLTRD